MKRRPQPPKLWPASPGNAQVGLPTLGHAEWLLGPDPGPQLFSYIKPTSEATSFSWPGADFSDTGHLPSAYSALPPLPLLLGGSPASSPHSAQRNNS